MRMNDMPRRKGSVGLGIVIAIAAPILFATLFMVLYGWKSWAINRHANLEYRRQVEARAMLEALKPQRPLRTWNSPDVKYALLYYKDDVHSSCKRVQLLEAGSARFYRASKPMPSWIACGETTARFLHWRRRSAGSQWKRRFGSWTTVRCGKLTWDRLSRNWLTINGSDRGNTSSEFRLGTAIICSWTGLASRS
jgi:hypothetical protein